MKKHDVIARMAPDAAKKCEANLEMIRKINEINVQRYSYNLSQRSVLDHDSDAKPKTGILGLLAGKD